MIGSRRHDKIELDRGFPGNWFPWQFDSVAIGSRGNWGLRSAGEERPVQWPCPKMDHVRRGCEWDPRRSMSSSRNQRGNKVGQHNNMGSQGKTVSQQRTMSWSRRWRGNVASFMGHFNMNAVKGFLCATKGCGRKAWNRCSLR